MIPEEPMHIYPLFDLRDHILEGFKCWCKPEENDYGVIVHNSMDGREKFETGERKLS